jgi:hypothetical protein
MRYGNEEKHCTEYHCDRCGFKFAESYPGEKDPVDNVVSRGATIMMPVLDGEDLSFRSMDICGDCISALCVWLREPKKRPVA